MAENQEAPAIINQWRLETWFPDLNPELQKQFKTYQEELIKFNKGVNLVPAKTIPFADALHFSDCILASRVITKANPRINEIYDLGSGNGFPGIVFAMLNPQIKVHLIDVDQKKCEFMKHIIASTHVRNANVLNQKVEDMKDGSMEFAITRGVASISKVIMTTRKSVPKGGVIYHLKGEQWGMEVSEIPIQLCSMWSPGLVGEYNLPIGEMKFSVIKTDKIA